MKYFMLFSMLFAFNLKAETDMYINDDLTLADEAIESPTMDIEGRYKIAEPTQAPAPIQKIKRAPRAPKKISSSDRLRSLRQKLEERNRIMIEKKMEQIRFQQEMALAKKLEASMNQTLRAIDNIK